MYRPDSIVVLQEVPEVKRAKLQAKKEKIQVQMLRYNLGSVFAVPKAVGECLGAYSYALVRLG